MAVDGIGSSSGPALDPRRLAEQSAAIAAHQAQPFAATVRANRVEDQDRADRRGEGRVDDRDRAQESLARRRAEQRRVDERLDGAAQDRQEAAQQRPEASAGTTGLAQRLEAGTAFQAQALGQAQPANDNRPSSLAAQRGYATYGRAASSPEPLPRGVEILEGQLPRLASGRRVDLSI